MVGDPPGARSLQIAPGALRLTRGSRSLSHGKYIEPLWAGLDDVRLNGSSTKLYFEFN